MTEMACFLRFPVIFSGRSNEKWTADDVLRGLMSYRFFLFFGGLASSQATLVTCRSQA